MKKILSFDLGITSIGFCVLNELEKNSYSLIDYGVVLRDNPYDGGTQQQWREYKQQRTLKEKRKKRIQDIKATFEEFKFEFEEKNFSNLWKIRAIEAFERKLSNNEFFALLRYFAKHRGYKSLKIEDLIAEIEAQKAIGDCESGEILEPDEEKFTETLAYLDAMKCKYPQKTVAQIIWDIELDKHTPNFRNHLNYKYMIRREDVKKEIEKIIEAQIKFGFFDSSQQPL